MAFEFNDLPLGLLALLTLGGAVRANYYAGDYASDDLARDMNRGDVGTFSLDTFRINADYAHGSWLGKFEYRFYPGYSGSNSDGYSFLHTGWLGYDFENGDQVQVIPYVEYSSIMKPASILTSVTIFKPLPPTYT